LGAKMNNAKLIASSLSHLTRTQLTNRKKEKLLADVSARVQKIATGEDTHTSIEDWAAWSIGQGLDLHYEFIKLNRGIMAISSLLDDSKSGLTFEDIANNVVLRNKAKVLSVLSQQDIVKFSEIFKFGIESARAKPQEPAAPNGLMCKSLF
jgi:hypothetical protein